MGLRSALQRRLSPAAGIKEGGRTGLVAVTVAACFGLSVFVAPLLQVRRGHMDAHCIARCAATGAALMLLTHAHATACCSLQAIPQLATAPVLVLVGAFMLGECVHIDWGCILTAVPAFLTIVIQARRGRRGAARRVHDGLLVGRRVGAPAAPTCAETYPTPLLVVQPFTFSISNGIYAGLLMSALLHLLTGEAFAPLLRRGSAGDAHAHPSPVAADVEAPLLGREQHPPSAVASPRGQPIAIAAVVRRLPSTPSDAGSDRQGGDARSFTLYLNTAGSLTLGSLGSLRGSSLTARQHGGGSSAGGPLSHDGHPPAHR